MTTVDWSGVRDRVLELGAMTGANEVFGARSHRFILEAPLLPEQVQEVEKQLGVMLPEEYRAFLMQVGAGGAGPSYGIFVLRKTEDGWRWFDDVPRPVKLERIGEPFRVPDNESAIALMAAMDASHPDDHPDEFPDPDSDETKAARLAWKERSQALIQELSAAGAIPLCHHGCGSREWLVVTGEQHGTMWADPEGGGISPHGAVLLSSDHVG